MYILLTVVLAFLLVVFLLGFVFVKNDERKKRRKFSYAYERKLYPIFARYRKPLRKDFARDAFKYLPYAYVIHELMDAFEWDEHLAEEYFDKFVEAEIFELDSAGWCRLGPTMMDNWNVNSESDMNISKCFSDGSFVEADSRGFVDDVADDYVAEPDEPDCDVACDELDGDGFVDDIDDYDSYEEYEDCAEEYIDDYESHYEEEERD